MRDFSGSLRAHERASEDVALGHDADDLVIVVHDDQRTVHLQDLPCRDCQWRFGSDIAEPHERVAALERFTDSGERPVLSWRGHVVVDVVVVQLDCFGAGEGKAFEHFDDVDEEDEVEEEDDEVDDVQ